MKTPKSIMNEVHVPETQGTYDVSPTGWTRYK